MFNRHRATITYAVLGAVFGLFFPIFSTLADIIREDLSVTWANCLARQSQSPMLWVIDTAPVFLGIFAWFAGRRQDRVTQKVNELNQVLTELEDLRTRQEEKIELRTLDLSRRNLQLETAAQIARDAAAISKLQDLLDSTVALISDRFKFYHAGIFLLDDDKVFAELFAASSKGGRRMLARSHRLQVGQTGIVGFVIHHNEARIALDVGADAVYFDNPDLPATRSEVAVPLRIRGEVIGALDIQSLEADAFDDEDVAIFQILADQIAVAIHNARLFEDLEKSLEAERQAYGHLGRESWRQLLSQQGDLAYRYDPKGRLTGLEKWRQETRTAVEQREHVLGEHRDSTSLTVPIILHDHVIGVIDAHKAAEAGEWSDHEITQMETFAEQMNLALDSARLHRESQRRVAKEQAVGHVARQLRGSLDMDTVLQTAVREIGEIMGLSEVQVQIAGERLAAR